MSERTSYTRPWTVSIDDEHCRAVIRDERGVDVVYIQDVLPSRAREDAQMLVDLASERDELRDLVRRMATQLSRSCPEKFGDWTREGDNACSLIAEARAAIGEGKE